MYDRFWFIRIEIRHNSFYYFRRFPDFNILRTSVQSCVRTIDRQTDGRTDGRTSTSRRGDRTLIDGTSFVGKNSSGILKYQQPASPWRVGSLLRILTGLNIHGQTLVRIVDSL